MSSSQSSMGQTGPWDSWLRWIYYQCPEGVIYDQCIRSADHCHEAKNRPPSVFLLAKEIEKEKKQPSSSCSVTSCVPQRPRWSCVAARVSKNVIMQRLQIFQVSKNAKSSLGWHFYGLYWASSESFSHAWSCSDTRTRQTLGHLFKAAKMCTHVDLNMFVSGFFV